MPDTRYKAEFEYKDTSEEESGIDLAIGDILICKEPADDGWLYGKNVRTEKEGYFPGKEIKNKRI